MAKAKSAFVCNECGGQSPQWAGQCPACGAWNSLTEVAMAGTASAGRVTRLTPSKGAHVQGLGETVAGRPPHLPTGLGELDRVLGEGLVAGSVVLIGGDPGIGKSTLLTQAIGAMARRPRRCT
jgi:DNA repair protein RadA/Sms